MGSEGGGEVPFGETERSGKSGEENFHVSINNRT